MQRSKRQRQVIDTLEQRFMLSATVTSQIPAQTLQTNSAAVSLSLGNYFNDPTIATGDTVVNLQTNLPSPYNSIPLELTTTTTPQTVANFLDYINSGEYADNAIYRAISGFIIQGGGYKTDGTPINVLGTLQGESSTATYNNSTGTIAMALSTGPNSGTDAWFINLTNNTELDDTSDGGPFTAFGKTIYNGLSTAEYLTTLPLEDDTGVGAFDAANIGEAPSLPVLGGTNGATVSSVPANDLVSTTPVVVPGGLTYTVTSTNSAVVSASVSGASLSVAPVATGTAMVTVTATDLGGGTASSSFAVTVAPQTVVLPTLSVSNASGTAGTNSQIVFPVTLSSAASVATTLDYTLTAGTAPSTDFTATASTLSIPAGATTASIPVTLVGDSTGVAESFTLTLSSLSSDATFANSALTESATGTINPASVVTGPAATTTTLTASSPVVALNGPDTFTATVSSTGTSSAPAGDITFEEGTTAIGTAALSNGVSTFATDLSTAGNEVITAVYAGDTTHLASTSNAVTVNVTSLAPVVTKNTVPVSVIAGLPVKGTTVLTLTNDTATAEKGTVTVNVFASADGAIDSSSVPVRTLQKKVNIAVGKSTTVSVSIPSLPANLPDGTYALLTQTIDPSGHVSDASSGPSVNVAAPVVSFVPSFVKLNVPASVVAGSKTSASAVLKITNTGNVTSTGVSTLALYASTDGTVADGFPINSIQKKLSIKPNKSAEITVPLKLYPSVANASYSIVAQVTDAQSDVTTSVSAAKVTIAAAEVDLATTVITVPTTATPGKSIAVTLELSNAGNIAASGKLEFAFSASPTSDGANAVVLGTLNTRINIKPGTSQRLKLKVPVPAGAASGSFFLVATADPSDVFNDPNLANNTGISATAINFG